MSAVAFIHTRRGVGLVYWVRMRQLHASSVSHDACMSSVRWRSYKDAP